MKASTLDLSFRSLPAWAYGSPSRACSGKRSTLMISGKVWNLIRGSRSGVARCRIPRPLLGRYGGSPKNPLQVVIEELINAGVNAQADAPSLLLCFARGPRCSRCDECSLSKFLQRLLDLLFCVHHERAVPRNGLVQRLPGDEQKADRRLSRDHLHRIAVPQHDEPGCETVAPSSFSSPANVASPSNT